MSRVIEGVLVYDMINDRYQVRYGLEDFSAGLHCGETLQVLGCDKKWHDSRIEYSYETESWYLVGFGRSFRLDGAKVKYFL